MNHPIGFKICADISMLIIIQGINDFKSASIIIILKIRVPS